MHCHMEAKWYHSAADSRSGWHGPQDGTRLKVLGDPESHEKRMTMKTISSPTQTSSKRCSYCQIFTSSTRLMKELITFSSMVDLASL